MSFENLGLRPSLLSAVTRAGYTTPTPIQVAAIPVGLAGRDLIACAQTGTGKTAAFVLPILQRFEETPSAGPALILAPTRELVTQIAETITKLSSRSTRIAIVVGGLSMQPQIRALRDRPHVIIATPGRLVDHLQRRTISLSDLSVLVLDEADRMLDMGFAPQLSRILRLLPAKKQTMLFSATMPSPGDASWKDVMSLALRSPERIMIDPPQVAENAEQRLVLVDPMDKIAALFDILETEKGSVLVFTRTKHRADRLAKQLVRAGVSSDRIHGDRTQATRQRALDRFRRSELRVLVATDVAARGIDAPNVAHVVNYDLPHEAEDYVHRVGRTARASRTGRATSFVLREERGMLRAIERLVGKSLPELILRPKSTAAELAVFAPPPQPRPQAQRPRPNQPARS